MSLTYAALQSPSHDDMTTRTAQHDVTQHDIEDPTHDEVHDEDDGQYITCTCTSQQHHSKQQHHITSQ